MTACAHYRRALLAEPGADGAESRAHADACHECREYTVRVRRFEGRLDHALRLDVGPSSTPAWDAARTAPGARRWLALAASALLAAVVAGGVWLASPGASLAADVVGHMADEPNAWARSDVPVSPGKLEEVLSVSGIALAADTGLVTYANSCLFRGHLVPHLVVQTRSGPVTVMLLTQETARATQRFDEHGYRGVIVPVPRHGSVAVLERGAGPDALAQVVGRVVNALR